MRTPGYNKKQEHRAGNALIWAKEHRRTVAKAVVICLILLLSFAVHFTNRNEEIIQTDEPGSLTDSGTESRFADASEPDVLQESNNVPIYVDISGAVHHPGVYEVSRQTRLFELIEKAGGLKETADIDRINQAAFLADGDKIVIPEKGGEGVTQNTGISDGSADGSININTAGKEDLMKLPGIGDAISDRIIAYREHTRFQTIEDIKNVPGIGEATYEKIKDRLSV